MPRFYKRGVFVRREGIKQADISIYFRYLNWSVQAYPSLPQKNDYFQKTLDKNLPTCYNNYAVLKTAGRFDGNTRRNANGEPPAEEWEITDEIIPVRSLSGRGFYISPLVSKKSIKEEKPNGK